ncbi:MAG: phosphomannomutase/phosphoglucomutase [Parcubacteria group bacterium CG08_land_8_20_14_0_20_48_21]|nr:MAG: phosphomannomutase/phosphoglucomutase [Parcubacteria group bacterium CG08_land_8_20_14_0_20_48_21]PIW79231.1 MAG: phosphomannomutase/phosphoglucomutase [Parcubacteria group bacterium CG_4_8_14_3_um_filter_48_16]PIY78295.1 MAG: phosphomannomutase/phosphoglucomutase [Parcubacteria group bacterium CG_4_10_14_0_8_um_filter_48_154]PIZ77708.1 MAG: phosphomannomutase/phosphoglucomutase [bacterium CG_4_10_14_0_2_um_filter_48_144]PJC39536.1 MAG: phosphomannomutase/phosphoglucomutase [Parcubacter
MFGNLRTIHLTKHKLPYFYFATMHVHNTLFKAYDVRGIYPEAINEQVAGAIARAYVAFLSEAQGRDPRAMAVVMGSDARTSSPALVQEVVRGLSESGVAVIDIGEVSTPVFYFAVKHFQVQGGMMVTASHNPAKYNGLKLTREEAIPIGEDTGLKEIKRRVEEDAYTQSKEKGVVRSEDIWRAYVEHVAQDYALARRLKVVIDAGNGMAGKVVPKLLPYLTDLKVTKLFFDVDFTFPNHEANPLKEENMVALQDRVVETGSDIGVAYDGDCDRVGFVTEEGVTVRGDIITALLARELLKERHGATILYDLRSSRVVKEVIEGRGGRAVETRVGHAFIKKQMRKENALFAGELSSHFYYQDEGYVENGDRTMLLLLRLLSESGKKFTELVQPLQKYFHTGEINSEVYDVQTVLQALKTAYPDAEQYELDGLTLRYGDWWCNVRPSNTEPVLRLNLEADTHDLMKKKRDEVLRIIRGN